MQLIKSGSKAYKKYITYLTPQKYRTVLLPISPLSTSKSVASTTTVIVKEINIRMVAFNRIFFANACVLTETFNTSDLIQRIILEDFSEALIASSKTEVTSKFKTALDTRIIEKIKSKSHLDCNVELPELSDTFNSLLMNCMFHKYLLDQHEELINKRVCILNFLAKPEYGYSKEKYNKYISRNNTSEMEGIVAEAKRTSKDKTASTKGRKENLQDGIIVLANLILAFEFLTNPNDCTKVPEILTMLHQVVQKSLSLISKNSVPSRPTF